MEIAVAAQSIPAAWYGDDGMLLTILDVLNKQAAEIKKRKR